jgi:hypothetical protein
MGENSRVSAHAVCKGATLGKKTQLRGHRCSRLQSQLLRRQRAGGSRFKVSPGKNLHKNRAGGVTQGVGPEFKPQYRQRKKLKLIT